MTFTKITVLWFPSTYNIFDRQRGQNVNIIFPLLFRPCLSKMLIWNSHLRFLKILKFSYMCVNCVDYMQIAIGPTAAFHNFMTFDRSAGRRREFYTRKNEIKQCYCVNLLFDFLLSEMWTNVNKLWNFLVTLIEANLLMMFIPGTSFMLAVQTRNWNISYSSLFNCIW